MGGGRWDVSLRVMSDLSFIGILKGDEQSDTRGSKVLASAIVHAWHKDRLGSRLISQTMPRLDGVGGEEGGAYV
jgi:hypothetical protein